MAQSLNTTVQQVSYQDAYDHVSRYVHSERQAITKMQKAISSGDMNLIRALTAYSATQGWNVGLDIEQAAQAAHDAFTAIAEDHRNTADQIRTVLASGNITAQGAQNQFDAAAARAGWADSIDAILGRAQNVVSAADQALATATTDLTAQTGAAQDQLLTEMRLTRAWERLRREFESQGTDIATSILEKLKQTTDPYETAAIIAEGPSYLLANGAPNGQVLINVVLRNYVPAIGEAADKAAAAHRFEVVIRHDAMVVRSVVATSAGAIGGLSAEGYIDPTTIDYSH